MEAMLRIIFIILFLHPATPIGPPARNVKIARMDWWRGAWFAGNKKERSTTLKDSGSQFELMECFNLCFRDPECGALWLRVTLK